MAETKRMTAEQVVSYLLEGEEGLDFLRESLRWVVQQLMEAEVSELIGAEHGERSPERLTHRNGYRPRRWDTRWCCGKARWVPACGFSPVTRSSGWAMSVPRCWWMPCACRFAPHRCYLWIAPFLERHPR